MESTINSKSKTKLSTQNQESTKKDNQNKLVLSFLEILIEIETFFTPTKATDWKCS